MYPPNLQSVAFPVREIIAIAVLGWGCEPQSWRKPYIGSEVVPFETAFVSSCRLSMLTINFSSLFTRFRDIAAFVVQHAAFPTPPLVSPKFPHFPLGVGGWRLGYEERRRWVNCPCN